MNGKSRFFIEIKNSYGKAKKMRRKGMRAVITVVGKDRIGIIAGVTTLLAENKINILDISQTILQDFFTMVMIVDLAKTDISFEVLQSDLARKGEEMGLSIKIQHENIFKAMHQI